MSTAIVVGANRGIGLEIARQLRGRGDTVIGVCRKSAPELAATGAEIIDGVEIVDPTSVATLAKRLGDRPIDLLVVAAGILKRSSLEDLDFDVVREQLEVNAIGPLRVATALLPNLKRGSKVAFLTSRMGSIADNTSGGMYGYRMSKSALNSGARSLALDVAGRGIDVAVLHPGFVRTDMTGGNGNVSAAESAAMLIARFDELGRNATGQRRVPPRERRAPTLVTWRPGTRGSRTRSRRS